MSIRKLLETAPLYELIQSKGSKDYVQNSVAYSGAPRKHPYDPEKMLLFSEPFSSNTQIFEFKIEDISHVEETASIGTGTGENLQTVKVWVKKGSLGIHYEPFEVQDTPKYYQDSELLHQVMADIDQ